jgi:hypothetical protein
VRCSAVPDDPGDDDDGLYDEVAAGAEEAGDAFGEAPERLGVEAQPWTALGLRLIEPGARISPW